MDPSTRSFIHVNLQLDKLFLLCNLVYHTQAHSSTALQGLLILVFVPFSPRYLLQEPGRGSHNACFADIRSTCNAPDPAGRAPKVQNMLKSQSFEPPLEKFQGPCSCSPDSHIPCQPHVSCPLAQQRQGRFQSIPQPTHWTASNNKTFSTSNPGTQTSAYCTWDKSDFRILLEAVSQDVTGCLKTSNKEVMASSWESQRPVLAGFQRQATRSWMKPDKPQRADKVGWKPLTKQGRKVKPCLQEIPTSSNEYSTPY